MPDVIICNMNSKHVLLVEDDVRLGDLTREILIECGYAVTLTRNWHEALEILTSNRNFDVVLLDLELGKNRGETLIEAARESGATLPKIIVL